ncbi:hypothetical protein [Shinella sp.]|uniref:hypothetical protein n=1 Tax=Shinella sp. TaxID=1870904 RepID=UPI0029A85CCC|nr:hypothetical protein [Shinella sp.]MDX3978228.1 hypothetical protein [Shinella sp.]
MGQNSDRERALISSIIPRLEARLAEVRCDVIVVEVEGDLVMELVVDTLRLKKNLRDAGDRKWLVREVNRNKRQSVLADITHTIAPNLKRKDNSSYWEDFSDMWQEPGDGVGQLLIISQASRADVVIIEEFLSLQHQDRPLVVLCVGVNIAGKLVSGPRKIARDALDARVTRDDIDRYLELDRDLSAGDEAALRFSMELVEKKIISPTQLICLLRLLPAVGFERARLAIEKNLEDSGINVAGHAVLAAVFSVWIETLEFSERLLLSALALLSANHQRVPRIIWEDAVRRMMGETGSQQWTFRLRSPLTQSLIVQDGDFVRFSYSTWAMAVHEYLAHQPEPFKAGIRATAIVSIGAESEKISEQARADRRMEILLDEMTALARSILQALPLNFWPQIDAQLMDVIRRGIAEIDDDSGTTTIGLIENVFSLLGLNSEDTGNIARTLHEAKAFANLAREALPRIGSSNDDDQRVGNRLKQLLRAALDSMHRISPLDDAATAVELKLLAFRIEQVELDLLCLQAHATYAENNVETVETIAEEVLEADPGAPSDTSGDADAPDSDDSSAASPEEPLHKELGSASEGKRHEASEILKRLAGQAADLASRYKECASQALSFLDKARTQVRNPELQPSATGRSVSARLNEILPGIYRHGAKAAQLAGKQGRERHEENELDGEGAADSKMTNSHLDMSEMFLLRGQEHQPSNIHIRRDILKFDLDVKCATKNSEVDLEKTNSLITVIKNDWKIRPHPYFVELFVNALRQYLSTAVGRAAPPPTLDQGLEELLNHALGTDTGGGARTRDLSKLISVATFNIGHNDLAVKIFDKLIEGDQSSLLLKSIIPGATHRVLQLLKEPANQVESAARLDNAIRFARRLDRVAIESPNAVLAGAADNAANAIYDLGLQLLADGQLDAVDRKELGPKLAASESEPEERENLTAYFNALSENNRIWRQLAWDSKIRHLRLNREDRSWRDYDRLLMMKLVSLMQDDWSWRQYPKSEIEDFFIRTGENEPLLRPMSFMKRLGLRREQYALACLIKSTTDHADSKRWRYEARYHTEQAEKLYRHATAFRERMRIWRVLRYLMEKEGRHIEAGYYENYIRRAQRTIDVDKGVEKTKWDAKAYLYAGRELMFVNGSEGRGALFLLLGISRADRLAVDHPLRRQLRILYAQSFWSRLYAQNLGDDVDGRRVGPPPLPAEELERFVSGAPTSLVADLLSLAAQMPRELKAGTFVAGRIKCFDPDSDHLVVEYRGVSGEPELAFVTSKLMPVTLFYEQQANPTLENLKGQIVPVSGLRATIDEHPAASMRGGKYCYDVINLIAPKIVTAYRRSTVSTNNRLAPQLSRNALVMGASNSWLVFRIHPDFVEMFRQHDGLLIKQLPPVLGLRRITFSKFSLERDTGEYKRAELEDFITAAWDGCSILSWNWQDKNIAIKTPGSWSDSRKSRTFSAMLKKAFPYDVKTVQLL